MKFPDTVLLLFLLYSKDNRLCVQKYRNLVIININSLKNIFTHLNHRTCYSNQLDHNDSQRLYILTLWSRGTVHTLHYYRIDWRDLERFTSSKFILIWQHLVWWQISTNQNHCNIFWKITSLPPQIVKLRIRFCRTTNHDTFRYNHFARQLEK